MDIVADFRASNSSMFPRATSASLSVSVKPKTINFPQSTSNRIGSASGKRLSNLQQPASQLPSTSQLSSSPNTSQLFGAAWQEAQQRPRSYSSSSPSNSSSPVPTAVNAGKDRSASEDLTEYRRDLYPNGLRGGPASRLAGGAGIPLPTLRSSLDQALGNISRPSSGTATGDRLSGAQAASGGAALPPPSSSLTSYASSPSDPAGLFAQTPHGRKDSSAVSSAALFLPVDDAAASAAAATRPQSKGGRGSKTPSPVPLSNETHNGGVAHHAAPAEKKKVRFMEPIAHPEPRVKAAAELPVRVPGKVAVMSATGAVREIRPILKTTAPPFAGHFGGIATGSLGDPHSFANARRAQVAAAQAYNQNVAAHLAQAAQTSAASAASAASPIVTTINAINTMNNTLSNKNIAVAAPVSANQSGGGARGGAVPRPATASAAVHSSSHSAAASAAVSSREAAMREMLLMDSPTNATALAFNARDSLTAQSAHLLRRTVEQLQLASAATDDAAAASVAEDVASSSALSSARSQYDDIDPAATRVAALPQPSSGCGIASGGGGVAGSPAASSALDDLRSHHLQTQQQLRQQLATQQSQQSEALFHDRRRPRTAGPGIVTADEPVAAADAALSSASAKQRDRRNSGELQQPLLGTVGLLSASLSTAPATASSAAAAAAAALAASPSSAAALFSLPAKAITLGTVSCSAVAPTQFFAQHAVLYLQPAFEAARSLTIPYAEMSALTLIGLRFRFKIPARLVSDALGKEPATAGGGGGGAAFVLVEFAPSARVQLVKERVVPLIAEAQASHAHAPQHLQLMAQAASPPAASRAAPL